MRRSACWSWRDFDGTLSTELAMIKDKQAFYHDMQVLAPANKNDGTPMKTMLNAGGGMIPKGAKNPDVAKDFMKYFMQPKVMNANLRAGLGRGTSAIPQIVKDDPWWFSDEMPCLKPYIAEIALKPTVPLYNAFSPAWGPMRRRADLGPGPCRRDQEWHDAGGGYR